MLTLERQNAIVAYLKQHKIATVDHLAKMFFIGQASIRRDLEKLEKQNVLRRTYGGAVLCEGLNDEIPISMREHERAAAKDHIGRISAEIVRSGDTIIIDSSTTSLHMIPHLKNRSNLTFITNGLKTAAVLGETLHTRVFCCGGILRERSLSLVGNEAKNFISHYNVQKMFFSCRAITEGRGALEASDEEAELRRAMIDHAEEVYLLCDSSKFDQTAFCQICGLKRITGIITEQRPTAAWLSVCEQLGVKLFF